MCACVSLSISVSYLFTDLSLYAAVQISLDWLQLEQLAAAGT